MRHPKKRLYTQYTRITAHTPGTPPRSGTRSPPRAPSGAAAPAAAGRPGGASGPSPRGTSRRGGACRCVVLSEGGLMLGGMYGCGSRVRSINRSTTAPTDTHILPLTHRCRSVSRRVCWQLRSPGSQGRTKGANAMRRCSIACKPQ